jgi:hypothetical protein
VHNEGTNASGAQMDEFGRTNERPEHIGAHDRNIALTYRRLGQSLVQHDDGKGRLQITIGIIALVAVLAFIGWIFTL